MLLPYYSLSFFLSYKRTQLAIMFSLLHVLGLSQIFCGSMWENDLFGFCSVQHVVCVYKYMYSCICVIAGGL